MSDLEWLIPGWLNEPHPGTSLALDGVAPEFIKKSGNLSAHLAGFLILIEDQTVIAFNLQLQVAMNADRLSWFELRIGEKGRQGMIRLPYGGNYGKRSVGARLDTIDWMYHVGFGDRE